MTKAMITKMSKNELRDFCIEIRTRISLGIASDSLVKLGVVAIMRWEKEFDERERWEQGMSTVASG